MCKKSLAITEIVTADQMRALEAKVISLHHDDGVALMERAGAAVVQAILDEWPEYATHKHLPWRAMVLCGPGNNGGDGFVIARLLHERGWEVSVLFYGEVERLPAAAAASHARWAEVGTVLPLNPKGAFFQTDLLIDALFGIGLTRSVDAFAGLFQDMNEAYCNMVHGELSPQIDRIIAVDIPSGLSSDSGRPLFQDWFPGADLTVTFHGLKPGHVNGEGPQHCGKVVVADIRIGSGIAGAELLRKSPDQHKYNHGHALILAGGVAQGGAARLAARAALRVGAGLVTLAPPKAALFEHAGPPDALMRRGVDDAGALSALLTDGRINALCLGPGAGVARAEALLPVVLASGRAVVLDADALTALTALAGMELALHDRCVLTPHMGEFTRLFPDLAADMDTGLPRTEALRMAAARVGATVLLKGADTLIAAPDGKMLAHMGRDVPWLATAGSGDVLAGIITGLLARGLSPLSAAGYGAALHAAAARRFGPGLIADDLPEMLPAVFRDMNL
ncbi:MAG: NAD(P)H-hydrate dehydratase [Paracoccus sp. (in: a-proteobacteria)]|uniref:NAD(P)H-hydrate dehydratase n=1 Tax=Paracoccus sp. TaxID=267 RepID=UPI0026DFBF59|nr:NAD(P)H-hydrate dehydratase [Paracoccus sp. (in: a-proteobacteria)]MDO5620185.1 NAD(P)H-hydrate dehydratase [Paracoccus sp. (in: a-proteobacteria)]